MPVFETLNMPKLISRKIWLAEHANFPSILILLFNLREFTFFIPFFPGSWICGNGSAFQRCPKTFNRTGLLGFASPLAISIGHCKSRQYLFQLLRQKQLLQKGTYYYVKCRILSFWRKKGPKTPITQCTYILTPCSGWKNSHLTIPILTQYPFLRIFTLGSQSFK